MAQLMQGFEKRIPVCNMNELLPWPSHSALGPHYCPSWSLRYTQSQPCRRARLGSTHRDYHPWSNTAVCHCWRSCALGIQVRVAYHCLRVHLDIYGYRPPQRNSISTDLTSKNCVNGAVQYTSIPTQKKPDLDDRTVDVL